MVLSLPRSNLWNWTEIAATSIDRVMVMSTYTNNLTTFERELGAAQAAIPAAKLGVGLSTLNLATNATMPYPDVQARFQRLQAAGAQEIDIWKMPIPSFWWPLIQTWEQS